MGILFLQRSAAIFYLIPIIIYFLFYYKKNSIKPIISSILGYTLIISLLTVYNYKKTNNIYFFPAEGKRDIYHYFSVPLLIKKNNDSKNKVLKDETLKAYKWLEVNNIKLEDKLDLNKTTNALSLVELIKNENENILRLHIIKQLKNFIHRCNK